MLLACGPENNLEKHRRSDNDTVMLQGAPKGQVGVDRCKSKEQ